MLTLQEITPANHEEVRSLQVHPHQQDFVATVDKSLADAFVYKDALARACYKEGVAVGFALIFPHESNGSKIVNIVRFLVAAEYQGRGIGRRFFQEVLHWIETLSPDVVRISTMPENEVALSLYKSFDFCETGIEDGEVVMTRQRT